MDDEDLDEEESGASEEDGEVQKTPKPPPAKKARVGATPSAMKQPSPQKKGGKNATAGSSSEEESGEDEEDESGGEDVNGSTKRKSLAGNTPAGKIKDSKNQAPQVYAESPILVSKSATNKVGNAKAKPLDNLKDLDSDEEAESKFTKKGEPGRTPASSAMKKTAAGSSKANADVPEKKKMFQGESSSDEEDEEDSDAEEFEELKKGNTKVWEKQKTLTPWYFHKILGKKMNLIIHRPNFRFYSSPFPELVRR